MDPHETTDEELVEELREALGGSVTGPEVERAVDIPHTDPRPGRLSESVAGAVSDGPATH